MSGNIDQLHPQLNALSEAAQAITSELSLEQVLHKIAEAARTLINAKYAALGVHDGYGNLSRFITAGISQLNHPEMGPVPTGKGLLGVFLHQGQALIVHDITHHPASAGFPTHHPPMQSLLGVPIFSKGELIGALYLTDKLDGSRFTEADKQLVEMLALHAAIAILAALAGRRMPPGSSGTRDAAEQPRTLDVSLFDAARSWADFLPPPVLSGQYACYNVYETADARHVALGALEPKFWDAFCRSVGRGAWSAMQFAADPVRTRLLADVAGLFRSRTQREWVRALSGVDCCFSAVARE